MEGRKEKVIMKEKLQGRCWLDNNVFCCVDASQKYYPICIDSCDRLNAKHKHSIEQSFLIELVKIGSELDKLNGILSKTLIKKEKKRWWKK